MPLTGDHATVAPIVPVAPPFGLFLSEVRVQDFRALRDSWIPLERGTTVLIGENNSGKTTFLEALAVGLGERRAVIEDLFQNPESRAKEFQVDLRLQPMVGEEFSEGVIDIIGDAIQLEAGKADFFTMRVRGTVADDGLEIQLTRSFVRGWARDRVAAAALPLLKSPPITRESLALLQFDMLDSRRDIVEQLRNRRTHWGKAISNPEIAAPLRTEIEAALKALGDDVLAGSPVLKKVRDDLQGLSQALAHGSLGVDVEALPRNLDDLVRAMDIIVTAPGSSAFGVRSQGMGTRSLAALLVFRSYVNIVRPRIRPDRILSLSAFEEPEAHLHPQSQRAVFRILSEIGGQRVLSTHSTHVASIADVSAFRLFRRKGAETSIHYVDAPTVASWGDPERVRRFIQIENPEVLFAKVVGIVEGQSEAGAFPVLAREVWSPRGADGVGVSLISSGGAGNSKHILPLLAALSIPWVIFCDGDAAADVGLAAAGSLLGRTLDRTSIEVVQLPAGVAFESYVVNSGFRAEAEGAAALHPEGPLSDFRARNHGGKKKGGSVRDYKSVGWEDRLACDFLERHKGTIGPLVGAAISKRRDAAGDFAPPPLVTDFFGRINAILGSA